MVGVHQPAPTSQTIRKWINAFSSKSGGTHVVRLIMSNDEIGELLGKPDRLRRVQLRALRNNLRASDERMVVVRSSDLMEMSAVLTRCGTDGRVGQNQDRE